MTRSRRRATATVLSIALVVGPIVTWLAAPSSAQTQIRVLDHEGPYEKDLDLGKEGTSPGDLTLGSHALYDADDPTAIVGHDFERLTILRVRSGGEDLDFIYDSTLRFRGSDIVLYGEGRYSDIFTSEGVTVPVTGGTGIYAGASGTATFTATQNEGETLITIDLIAP
ncbi:MAG TPA: hypothetical protein VE976_00795 [Actinomycetota bacterium]|jgi:hypothetical protein|nr:hypothetical protein [Actinomycetota bacterium]